MWGIKDDELYEKAVGALEEAVLAYLDERPELKATPNSESMWDFSNAEEDVY